MQTNDAVALSIRRTFIVITSHPCAVMWRACLFASQEEEPRVQISRNFPCTLPMVVNRSSFAGAVISYVLPVLRMTSCCRITDPIAAAWRYSSSLAAMYVWPNTPPCVIGFVLSYRRRWAPWLNKFFMQGVPAGAKYAMHHCLVRDSFGHCTCYVCFRRSSRLKIFSSS